MRYNVGDKVAYLEPSAEGSRIYQAEVTTADGMRIGFRVGIDNDERFTLVDKDGYALAAGEPKIVPLDDVLATDLANRGDGFLIHPNFRDVIDIAESIEEATAQIEARLENAPRYEEGHGYGY